MQTAALTFSPAGARVAVFGVALKARIIDITPGGGARDHSECFALDTANILDGEGGRQRGGKGPGGGRL